MRVVLATSSFFSDGGGIASYAREFCSGFLRAGHQILVITRDEGDITRFEFACDPRLTCISCPIPRGRPQYTALAMRLHKAIVDFAPQAVVSSNHSLVTSIFQFLSPEVVKVTISHFYDGILAESAIVLPEYTDWIIALSSAGREWLLRHSKAQPSQVVSLFNTTRPFGIKTAGNSVQPIKLIFLGGSKPSKGADIVMTTVNNLAKTCLDWQMTWIGPLALPLVHLRIDKMIPARARQHIIFTGEIPRSEVNKHIRNAHFILLPSRGEGCPLALLEAMSCGTIPIVSDCPSAMREIILHGQNGFVYSLRDFASGVRETLLLANDEIQRISDNVLDTYNSVISPDHWYAEMLSLVSRKNPGLTQPPAIPFDESFLIRWMDVRYNKISVHYLSDRMKHIRYLIRLLPVACRGMRPLIG